MMVLVVMVNTRFMAFAIETKMFLEMKPEIEIVVAMLIGAAMSLAVGR